MKIPYGFRILCPTFAFFLVMSATQSRADDWPQWRGPQRDGIWRETGLIDRFEAPQIELKWRTPVGSGYCGPTVADGRVYVMDLQNEAEQGERVLCFDAADGKPLWQFSYACSYRGVQYPAGPRASVTLDEGRAFALGTKGHFHCLDARSGHLLWKKAPGTDYDVDVPIWGIASAPIVVDDLVVAQVGAGDGACVIAWEKSTGRLRWQALDDRASSSAPILIEQAGRRVLVCWTGDHLAGLDPLDGMVHWKVPFKPAKMVINVPTPVVNGDRIFLTGFYDGAMMVRLSADTLSADQLWRRRGLSERQTDALHSMIVTPIFDGEHIYGVDSYGELRCLDAATGDRIWEDLTAVPTARWANIHMVRNGDHVWMFNERGELLIGSLAPDGFREISRAKLIEPTMAQLRQRGGVCWSHPAYAGRCIFARNDEELVCADLSAE